MHSTNALALQLDGLKTTSENYANDVLNRLRQAACSSQASDIHIESMGGGLTIRWRRHGQLAEVATIPEGVSTQILGRIKALAQMMSYRCDIPQEGRFSLMLKSAQGSSRTVEARVSTLPLVEGERVVIRVASQQTINWLPQDLGLPLGALERLQQVLAQNSGMVLISGPAGSGKTTTAYACLRYLLAQTQRPRSIVSLEDPVESQLQGVAQSQINIAAGYTWSDGIKAVLRQDPEVLLVGEIRDDETARIVFQAAMTGQLVITTIHARSTADALRRLLDMQVPVHHLRSTLDYLICQKLIVEETSPTSSGTSTSSNEHSNVPPLCGSQGTNGNRRLLVELLPGIEGELSQALAHHPGARELEAITRRALEGATAGEFR